jgi:hypothetical protein
MPKQNPCNQDAACQRDPMLLSLASEKSANGLGCVTLVPQA